jgi:hypothetical protein
MGQGLYGYRKWLFMQWPFLLEVISELQRRVRVILDH